MAFALAHTRALLGLEAPLVAVEVHLSGGLPRTSLVGLPAAAVRESKDRVRAALVASDFQYPNGRVVINLGPADLPKEGGRFDLPIALGILAASGQLPAELLAEVEVVGELSLNGGVQPVRGAVSCAVAARDSGRGLLLPAGNAREAAFARAARLFPVSHLAQARDHLLGTPPIEPFSAPVPASRPIAAVPDLSDVRGQETAKRALEVAAAGGHHLLMVGPPGTGKTMLATRLPGLLPPMSESQALETMAIYSARRLERDPGAWRERPFRAPHHTTSAAGLAGGGAPPRPGEISLAHHGILFLDELAELGRPILDVLREPLESGRITIVRAACQAEFPARFQLVAAMNPCPCGYLGDGTERCRCLAEAIRRYQARVSGPLIDRFDLHLPMVREPPRTGTGGSAEETGGAVEPSAAGKAGGASETRAEGTGPAAAWERTSERVRTRVAAACEIQVARGGKLNRDLDPAEISRLCPLPPDARSLLQAATRRLALSERAVQRVLRVTRTIADLEASERPHTGHLAEALAYRGLDRFRLG